MELLLTLRLVHVGRTGGSLSVQTGCCCHLHPGNRGLDDREDDSATVALGHLGDTGIIPSFNRTRWPGCRWWQQFVCIDRFLRVRFVWTSRDVCGGSRGGHQSRAPHKRKTPDRVKLLTHCVTVHSNGPLSQVKVPLTVQ